MVTYLYSSKMDQDIQWQSAVHSIIFIKHLLFTRLMICAGDIRVEKIGHSQIGHRLALEKLTIW